jgi:fructose-bisphosphate aldolase class II
MTSFRDLGIADERFLLQQAYKEHYAVPAFNFVFMEQLLAIVDACIERRSPFILQASSNTCKNLGIAYVRALAAASAERVSNETGFAMMALNLDHGLSYEECVQCIDNGFSAVMIDGSMFPLEENIVLTKRVADYAHKYGVTVEGELGALSGSEDEEDNHGQNRAGYYTDPKAVRHFVEETKVDCLAVSIGTSHGLVKIKPDKNGHLPELRFDILAEIEGQLPGFPIVLHGSSCIYPEYVAMINTYGGKLEYVQGIPEEYVRRGSGTNICKINVASDGWIAALAATRKALSENIATIDPRTFLRPARQEMKDLYIRKIDTVMGSAGKGGNNG